VAENVIGRLKEDFQGDYSAFFENFDRWLYSQQKHILYALDLFDWRGKNVLEIGLGQGADSEQLIRRGALWSGIDLTWESVERVRQRMQIRNLPYKHIVQGSAVRLPFSDARFDIVYSHGVLHHIPDIKRAQQEIRRILKDDGRLIMMVYARHSLNYHLAIRIIRRLGLAMIYLLPIRLPKLYEEHKRRARETGLWSYLRMENFIHRSTDGSHNPYSKVYDRQTILDDFEDFEIVRTFKLWMHAPPLPVDNWTPGRWLGWHLWAELKPRRLK
jgi:ubiquinone/menaquinone biosynthesis C-methylase UbiE